MEKTIHTYSPNHSQYCIFALHSPLSLLELMSQMGELLHTTTQFVDPVSPSVGSLFRAFYAQFLCTKSYENIRRGFFENISLVVMENKTCSYTDEDFRNVPYQEKDLFFNALYLLNTYSPCYRFWNIEEADYIVMIYAKKNIQMSGLLEQLIGFYQDSLKYVDIEALRKDSFQFLMPMFDSFEKQINARGRKKTLHFLNMPCQNLGNLVTANPAQSSFGPHELLNWKSYIGPSMESLD
ncbi:MAG: hypothetical protein M0P38_03890 [Bacteroidales bacterium]|nr:hypothetical protein [Bacteroidales bacterium]